ncbi:MAG: hypothetical protein JWP87_6249 [Labilithrix sp.]|nr:hypothetical protein [Labilithrix sp.]
MRPSRDRAASFLAVVPALPMLLVACGKQAFEAPPAAKPVEVVVADPAAGPPPVVPAVAPIVPPMPEADPETEPEPLPKTWTGPIVPGLSFDDALRKARGARDGFERLATPSSKAKEASIKAWFGQANGLVDHASRMYAAAFHAPDAPREGRIDAIAEAAELDMTMARSLDEAGLGAMPAAWRSDPAVAITFEDVAVGPTRRWRDEARVLARQCIGAARESGVVTDAARRCTALRTGVPVRAPRRTADAGASGAECACSAGDPLCSASLGGWCFTARP